MTTGELTQIIGAVVAGMVVVNEFFKHIKEWRGGTPELRLVAATVEHTQANHTRLLEAILAKLEIR